MSTLDRQRQLSAARERARFWMDLRRSALPPNRQYFSLRADYWISVVEELEQTIP